MSVGIYELINVFELVLGQDPNYRVRFADVLYGDDGLRGKCVAQFRAPSWSLFSNWENIENPVSGTCFFDTALDAAKAVAEFKERRGL